MKLDSYYRYEIKAQAFQRMTGHMAPGKDAPSASYPAPSEERQKLWAEWVAENDKCIEAMLFSFERVID